MKTNVLLAVDVSKDDSLGHVPAAVEMIRSLVDRDIDSVIVLYVEEFSLPGLAHHIRDHVGIPCHRKVDEVVAALRSDHIHANALIREADFGHVAPTILEVAEKFDVRCIVLCSRSRSELPRLPIGSVTAHLLRLAKLPVVIVPAASPAAIAAR
jgi:nucleotide-binding universal stress UspA family protein